MTEMQRLLDGTLVPTRRHYDDLVECSDGTVIMHGEAHYDCNDNPHSTEEDRHEAEVTIVSDILDQRAKWVCEYATENDDYTSMYDHIIGEVSHEWPDRMRGWFRDNLEDYTGHSKYDDCKDRLIEAMCDECEGEWDGDWEFSWNEYAAYSGSGCCLWGADIGECEEQIEINRDPVLKDLHDSGRLNDILDDVNCDLYVSRHRRREKNEETGRYEYVGREHYDHDGSDYPDIMGYVSPGGRHDYVISEEKMREYLTAAIIGICRQSA
jgi:hypothetical protein